MADQAVEFKVQVQGLSQITAAFGKAPSIIAPILQRALSASSAILASHTVRGVVPWRTGFLTQSFRAEIQGLVLRWFPTASYAPFVEFGTKPHDIFPVNKKALFWSGAAHPVAVVHHPGTKPNDFMGRIVEVSQEEINTMFGTALSQITAAIAAQAQA
jgi:bacteriophage HK97-gp10 putative tail-component